MSHHTGTVPLCSTSGSTSATLRTSIERPPESPTSCPAQHGLVVGPREDPACRVVDAVPQMGQQGGAVGLADQALLDGFVAPGGEVAPEHGGRVARGEIEPDHPVDEDLGGSG